MQKKTLKKQKSKPAAPKPVMAQVEIAKTESPKWAASLKMGMTTKIIGGLVGLLILIVVVGSFQPDQYSVSRAIIITAPSTRIFNQINNFHNWQNWSVWEKQDPTMKMVFEGPETGTGSICHWEGNDVVGSGTMTITDSKLNDHVFVKVEFTKPFQATNTTQFVFQPGPKETYVGWSMTGTNDLMTKIMHLFVNTDDEYMNKMVGGNFQNSLEHLKALTQPNYKIN